MKVIETEWKMSDNRENVTRDNSQRALSLCNDATMDELLNDVRNKLFKVENLKDTSERPAVKNWF